MGARRGVYRVLIGKPEGKCPAGKHKHRWKNNTKINLQDMGCGNELDSSVY
jgi:hypothetical protein